MKLEKQQSDILIIGGGLAGLRAAYEAACAGCSVTVVSKGPRCSGEVSGFNVPVGRNDSVELFAADIARCGCGVGNPELIRRLAEDAAKELAFLESLGFHPQKNGDGSYTLLQPLQCTVPRLIHHGTQTGAEAELLLQTALERYHVRTETSVTVLKLLTDGNTVCGALAYRRGADRLTVYEAKSVVLAAGGCSGMFSISTYPKEICGDSAALAWDAGADLVDMEFQDYEPCCLAFPEHLRGRGISSTMLFAGGKLLNNRGESIVEKYFLDPGQISKISLAKAIYQELQAGNGSVHGGVYYDLRGIPLPELKEHETYLPLLMRNHLDPANCPLEVTPAAHTCLGGVKVDGTCASTVSGLYAAGEAMGGLHGAARIGGNAGTEVFVFGAIAGRSAAGFAKSSVSMDAMEEAERFLNTVPETSGEDFPDDANALRQIISQKLPLLRNAGDLNYLREELRPLQNPRIAVEMSPDRLMRNLDICRMAQTAGMIAAASLMRRESRGVFCRNDFPETRPEYDGVHIVIRKDQNEIIGETEKLEESK